MANPWRRTLWILGQAVRYLSASLKDTLLFFSLPDPFNIPVKSNSWITRNENERVPRETLGVTRPVLSVQPL